MWFAVPKGCLGFDLEDGRSIAVNKFGSVEINDELTIQCILNCANFKAGHIIKIRDKSATSDALPQRICDGCGRSAWPYQTVCGSCGYELEPL